MRLRAWIALSLLSALVLLAGCGGGQKPAAPAQGAQPGQSAAAPAPKKDQKPVVVLQGVDPTRLDPHMHSETPAFNVLIHMYDALVDRDENMKLVPGLATSWKALNDTTWEFKLRQGVKWHDGNDFTAEDVKFSIDRILDPNQKSNRRPNLAVVKEVKIIDPYTVQIVTEKPFPILPNKLADEHIVSKKFVTGKSQDELDKTAMGTGPYKFVKWVKGEELVMEANPNYWKGAPKIQKVIFKPVPEAATRIAQLQSGQADIIVNVPFNQVEALRNGKDTAIAEVPSVRVIYIGTQGRPGKGGPLENPKVRRALAMGIDGDSLIKNVLLGNGYPVAIPLTPEHFGYTDAVKPVKFDPDGAKKLLAEAGVTNLELQFDTPNGRYNFDKEMAEAIAGQLQKNLGIKVNLKVNEWGNHVALMQSREQKGLYLLGWGNASWDADGTLVQLLTSKGSFSTYQNSKFDELVAAAATNMDPEKRKQLYADALKIFDEERPWIYQWRQKDVYGVSKRINWKARSDERIYVYSATLKE